MYKSTLQKYTAGQMLDFLKTKDENFWMSEGKSRALDLFHNVAQRVPAYRDFLKKNNVVSEKVNTFEDFTQVPAVTKDNYLRNYPLESLCWDGTLDNKSLVFTSTSGSTGRPFYFPRDEELDMQSSVMHEMFLRQMTGEDAKSILIVDAFGMGVWIGGLITYQAFQYIAQRGQSVTIITPGIVKKEIFEALLNLAPKFDRIVLCGYPPFVKDIIDEGEDIGIDFPKMDIKFIFAAEGFSEKFRDYIIKKAGVTDVYRDITNIYGTADLGTMAQETPISVLMRRRVLEKKGAFKNVFSGISKVPTLAQFNPLFIYFETENKDMYCTGYNALPLIRYSLGDHGGVVEFSKMRERVKGEGIDIEAELTSVGIHDSAAELPFVYVYERADLSTKLYGAIIYPEHIKEAVQEPALEHALTGKFTISTKTDKKEDQYLEINLELKPSAEASDALHQNTKKVIVDTLVENNGEYKNNYSVVPAKVTPRLVFWPYQHETYFKPGGKQKWVEV